MTPAHEITPSDIALRVMAGSVPYAADVFLLMNLGGTGFAPRPVLFQGHSGKHTCSTARTNALRCAGDGSNAVHHFASSTTTSASDPGRIVSSFATSIIRSITRPNCGVERNECHGMIRHQTVVFG